MSRPEHHYPFDPTYGYDLDALLAVEPPAEPAGYAAFWRARYARALAVDPEPRVTPSGYTPTGMLVSDLSYRSTDGFPIRGWLLEPAEGPVTGAIVVGHGYGGLDRPDMALPRPDFAYLVPCFRGLGLSARAPISTEPRWHVLHDIHLRERYVLGGCVEDVWAGVSALAQLRPGLDGHIGYLGTSFGGGVGAMAMAWDDRIASGHLDVPSFGHQQLRLTLPTCGSAAAVQAFARECDDVADTLAYYDAAVAARHIEQPVHLAAAMFDPVVAPPGQFAIYNALPGIKELFVRSAGHVEHPRGSAEHTALLERLQDFFAHESRVPQMAQPSSRA